MGDVIHALPAVATLKHSLPGSCVCWVIDPKWAGLLEGNPFVDEIIPFDRRALSGLKSAWRQLRSRRYQFAVDFQGLLKSALVASAARPERIYGFHQSQVRERLAALFYSNRVRAQSAHVVDRNLELAAAAGASAILSAFPLPEGAPEGKLPEGDFVLASPLAGWPGKQWPLEHYSFVARLLRSRLGVPLVLNGPPQAADLLAGVADAVAHVSGVPGLIHATRRARAVVGIDSGPTHLAAALGKPGVAIYGPTDPARNGPYGESFVVLREDHAVTSYKRSLEIDPAMRAIPPEQVFEILQSMIAGRGRRANSTA
ncbi:MAG: glycosyltransferase family 9 protein [Bryobacteraceae bacterium]